MLNELQIKHRTKISDRVNRLIEEENWNAVINILKLELAKYPNEHWILTTLANAYFEKYEYQTALKYSESAMKIENRDYLVLNNHACILSMIPGLEDSAISLFELIINSEIKEIAYGEYGEGMKWAKYIKNDCRARLGLLFFETGRIKEAKEMLSLHLKNRMRGQFSNFTKKYVLSKILSIS